MTPQLDPSIDPSMDQFIPHRFLYHIICLEFQFIIFYLLFLLYIINIIIHYCQLLIFPAYVLSECIQDFGFFLNTALCPYIVSHI